MQILKECCSALHRGGLKGFLWIQLDRRFVSLLPEMVFSFIVYFCVLWYMLYFVAFSFYLWYFHILFAFNSVFLIVICVSELNWHLSDRNRQKVSESPIDSSNSVHTHLHSSCTVNNALHTVTAVQSTELHS